MHFITDLILKLDPAGLTSVFIILAVFVFSLIINLFTRGKYIAIYNDLERTCSAKNEKFETDLLNKIVETYKSASVGNYNHVNTRAIIENCFNRQLKTLLVCERFVKHTALILVALGLLGTFLSLSINPVVQSDVLSNSSFADFLNDLMPWVRKIGVAFTASFFGMAFAVLFALVNIVLNAEDARRRLTARIEEYLDNTVSRIVAKDKETEYNMMNRILKETFAEFGKRIEKSLKQTADAFGQKLTTVAMEVDITSKTLDNTVDKFDRVLQNFAENIKEFKEFNDNLKNNIEKMDGNFEKVAQALNDTSSILKDTSKTVVDNYNSVESFSKSIRSVSEEITGYSGRIVQDISNIAEEVKVSVSSIRELGEAIRNDLVVRTEELKDYQEKFNILTSRLSEELNLLREKTAEAFERSLDENSQVVAEKITNYVDNVMKGVMEIINEFKENEKIFAKTIVMLPEQITAYNETAAAQMSKQLDEVKRLFRKFE